MSKCSSIATGSPVSDRERIAALTLFWQAVLKSGDPGATKWEDLEYLYHRVQQCLGAVRPDLDLAESITAEALFLMTAAK